jgi:uncharacterized protein YndB with AHSA1/START domain
MNDRETYAPGGAAGAEVRQEGDRWTLVLVRESRHPPTKVWQALTDPAQLREWAPFDTDRQGILVLAFSYGERDTVRCVLKTRRQKFQHSEATLTTRCERRGS